ncbi:heparinase II/III domain-containing protein [Candidatus Contendibacter odensensis]|uniref:Heparinase II/III-like C-terminal domain-containing protein n=1 Tax=Candidatus Contendobacter odensis Run_B_J11 TaxID=1400861 RepID=A0A7U7G8A4_9GAMM|nr:heparinase II/III family protein [Candidatus Contendobacter odensis]CDH43543.1 hypothetical protein BN874_1230053 [Candidatus Contendobacter odensis Run_B_J11]
MRGKRRNQPQKSKRPQCNEGSSHPTLRPLWWGYATGLTMFMLLVGGSIEYIPTHYPVTLRQLAQRGLEWTQMNPPWLVAALKPGPRYRDHLLDGQVRAAHPRIVLPELAEGSGEGIPAVLAIREAGYRQRGLNPPGAACSGGDMPALAACWVSTGDPKSAQRLLTVLRQFAPTVSSTTSGDQSGACWEAALAYDLLHRYSGLTNEDRQRIEIGLESVLGKTLEQLDDDSPSLWHGRSTLAADAWLCAVVLDPTDAAREQLVARAQGHFLETIKALELTEGWPEGYNYWINSRAFLIALAGSAYLNGLERGVEGDRVRRALRRVGYWTLYATRPDHRIEALGDEGPRVDLKDETRRVIDLIAQVTHDPVLAAYSAFLGQLHGAESYYRDYRWGFRLFNDPSLAPVPGAGIAGLFSGLPSAELFGRNALNLAYIRSGWTPDATFISFRAGDAFTHHGHYDAGHFSLFKGAPLAINSGAYGGFFSPNRLNYAIRSIAKNTLLILRPGEKVQPNRFFADNVADGGQRVVLPTGSAIRDVQHWLDNRDKGLHLEGGRLERFEHREGDYTYIAADLAAAYNTPAHDEGGWGGKVEQVERQLLYLPGEDRLLVRDRVRAVKADFVKKWLLHTVEQPQVEGIRVLKGDRGNGILESNSDMALVQNGRGWLTVQRILPQDAVIRLVGGRDYQYYVEADGDDTQLDGVNFNQGASTQPWFDIGMWRLEIQPGALRPEDAFLMVLTPALGAPRRARAAPLSLEGRSGSGVLTEASAAVFLDKPAGGELRLTLPAAIQTIRVIGLPPLARVELRSESGATPPIEQTASSGGVAVFSSSTRQGRLVLRWP